jgi:hypothetical protein
MIEKFRVGLALQPVANALFATSPFKEGKPTGYVDCLNGHADVPSRLVFVKTAFP